MKDVIHLSPVTRIEGHLGVQLDMESGKVSAARVTGEMFRGFENLLRGRAPLDAQLITQRICGVCPVEHGIASIQAQDQAYRCEVPDNGRLLRNIIQAANFITSHITHFYLLSGLDFVNVGGLLEYQGKDQGLLDLRDWAKAQLAAGSVNPVGPFLPQFPDGLIQNPELNLGVLRHYLDALEARRKGHRLGALFAGKLPHAASLIPGGVTEQVDALKMAEARALLRELRHFVHTAYLPDILAVGAAFPDYFKLGLGCGNYLAYGAFPDSAGRPWFPPGVLSQGRTEALDLRLITEEVGSSWFSSPSKLSPGSGETKPAPDKPGAYSWLKAPRYQGRIMEVGALARVLVAYKASGPGPVRNDVERTLALLDLPLKALESAMGRHVARALESVWLLDCCSGWIEELVPGKPSCLPFQLPVNAEGCGITEAARGALGHWLVIRDSKIANYQCVVPTTWNCSPRDDAGLPGPMEQAIAGTEVKNPATPIEVARIIRSFDPCLACAVH